ncbi:MAG: leucine--tRNA ligase [Thermoleophilia bacterium]|nr:leucine--tRNA ligase [Thermoleophilia bacterium]MDH4338945.1 leucine--tRNA ligase [Thermoleophilia bacterium]MDH5280304.1 leucine--tRNA ligase [Thermoleophilia bacterium]
MDKYEPTTIEEKWQRVWKDAHAFEVPNPGSPKDDGAPKSYVLEQLPYPSGTLHMGHMLVYTIGDVVTRYRSRNGMRVLHPQGFDSFGLPAENAAIREGGHPREIVERNIAHITRSMRRIGWAYDWRRELSTHEPEYYRWQQWQFLKFYERGLAYRKGAPVKWCPVDQTVLANEQVHDGRCERCGAEVESRLMDQWFFRITDYAQALLDDLETVDWPESIKARQRNWIGRSDGAEILFRIEELDADVPVFTTRPDTLYGATFFVLAPEHSLVVRVDSAEVREYVRRASAKRTEERAAAEEKTGVVTGLHAVNPVNGERLPVFVADYVLTDYGTGAIMAVPAHDPRDFDFATAFGLPVRHVIRPADDEVDQGTAYVGHTEGEVLVNSGEFDGLPAPEGGRRIVEKLAADGRGRSTVNYRLRDWGFSRQRYWGCPIPVVYCDACGIVPVSEDELPVLLPEIEDFKPKGKPPLAQAEEWVSVPCPRCEQPARRETETMDTFVDSSWYFLRYCDARNDTAPFAREAVDYWNPVDLYIGGVDHATMHMIYARFWVKVLNDLGLVGFREPFARFFSNGWVTMGKTKMSKRAGNVVGPDDFVERYGADACRLNILFLGPANEDMEWTEEGVEGMARFVRRLWRVVNEVVEGVPSDAPEGGALARKAHATIAKVSDDIGRRYAFNTAIAAMMELVNELSKDTTGPDSRLAAETVVSLIQPYAPHAAEELWERLGYKRLWEAPWPVADPALLEVETVEVVVQVNGRVRERLHVPPDTPDEELVALARSSERVQSYLDGSEVARTIVVPGKLVSFVT